MIFAKTLAWTWLGIVFSVITGLAIWQVVSNPTGAWAYFSYLWLGLIFFFSLIAAIAIIGGHE